MKTDNRGFTLTELIVSIAIFAIVAAAAYGFMVAGANSYSSVSDALSRQLRSQMTFSQIENRLIDCNSAVYATGNSLYIVNKNEAAPSNYDVYVYKLNDTDHVLYFGKNENQVLTLTDGKLTANSVADYTANEVLAKKVSHFSAAKKDLAPTDTTKVRSVSVTLILQTGKGADGTSDTQIIALRNTPLLLG